MILTDFTIFLRRNFFADAEISFFDKIHQGAVKNTQISVFHNALFLILYFIFSCSSFNFTAFWNSRSPITNNTEIALTPTSFSGDLAHYRHQCRSENCGAFSANII